MASDLQEIEIDEVDVRREFQQIAQLLRVFRIGQKTS